MLTSIDDFYYQNLSFDSEKTDAYRFSKLLMLLTQLLGDGQRTKVINYEAISLVLLVDSLPDDFTPAWRDKFAESFDTF